MNRSREIQPHNEDNADSLPDENQYTCHKSLSVPARFSHTAVYVLSSESARRTHKAGCWDPASSTRGPLCISPSVRGARGHGIPSLHSHEQKRAYCSLDNLNEIRILVRTWLIISDADNIQKQQDTPANRCGSILLCSLV